VSYLRELPDRVADLIRASFVAEFATVSQAGIPINTPLVPFLSEDLETIDCATGLAYPAKADRARRNPKIGMLFEGTPDQPVVSIAGFGAVRDADLQANLERYLAEEILTPSMNPDSIDYETVTRHAIWYFTRIIICSKPAHIRWWDNPASMDKPPWEWRAADGTVYPQSDSAPGGAASKGSWHAAPWQDLARSAVARGAPAHLTLLDDEGFPIPIRARKTELSDTGFQITMPGWLPWSAGPATVSFQGLETFIGDAVIDNGLATFRADRCLPIHPLLVMGPLMPDASTKQTLLDRIDHELARRGKVVPIMPEVPPAPTSGARLRASAAQAFNLAGT
jgi:hypothetical protein